MLPSLIRLIYANLVKITGKMLLFLEFLDRVCLNLVYRSIIGKRKIVMFLVMLPSLIMLISCEFSQIHIKCLDAATNPIYVFNAYNVYYSQASTTNSACPLFRSVLEVKVKGQLTSMSITVILTTRFSNTRSCGRPFWTMSIF